MEMPKFILATDGHHTAALLDGVVIGSGIERLDFSTENKAGEMKSIVRIMDLNIDRAAFSTDTGRFMKWINGEEE